MSSNRRDGEWLLPRLFRAVAFMGELHLDLTRVRLGAGVSEIELVAIMGQVNVRVPQNLRLEVHGQPVMGELQVNWGATGTASADAPLLRIHAGGFMGALVVDVVDPNAAGWLDRWRTKRRSR